MCGVFGSVGHTVPSNEIIRRLRHRGPDDDGVVVFESSNGPVVLVSTRLAIRDLSPNGHMPMQNEDGTVTLSYNGELFDTDDLERRVRQAGLPLRSSSDTELVLRAYELFGADCVDHLDGMFAFAIWDQRRQQMFIARDRFGIKPLYYSVRGLSFVCSSEVKAILALPGFQASIDPVALQQYLTFLWVPDPRTMFDGICKLEAGHCAIFRNGQLSIRQYWDLDFPRAGADFPKSEEALIDEFRSLFDDSVRRHMISDVPVGAFLSAGLDSSSIVASMAKHASGPVKTYTIAFPSSLSSLTMDDTAVAARTAAHFGCDHHQIDVEPNVVDLLPKVVWHMDEPVADPAAITAYLVNQEARKDVTVVMSGVGGDELLAGYRKHVAQRWATLYRRIPKALTGRALPWVGERIPAFIGTRLADPIRLTRKMIESGTLPPDDMFLRYSTYLTRPEIAELLTPDVWKAVEGTEPWAEHRRHFAKVGEADELNRLLYVDTKAFMASLNLTYNDKMSMANSTEVRLPFLDRRLAEFCAREVPPGLKLHGGMRPTTKHLLRRAMADRLPAEVFDQRKAGFGAPLGQWLTGDLGEVMSALASESRLVSLELINPQGLNWIVARHRTGRHDLGLSLWAILTLEHWLKAYADEV